MAGHTTIAAIRPSATFVPASVQQLVRQHLFAVDLFRHQDFEEPDDRLAQGSAGGGLVCGGLGHPVEHVGGRSVSFLSMAGASPGDGRGVENGIHGSGPIVGCPRKIAHADHE
jgi:hypothetical protein